MLKEWYLLIAVLLCTACASQSNPNPTPSKWLDEPAFVQAQAIIDGKVTSSALVSGFLARIEQLDKKTNSILALNPNALAEAKAIDKKVANGEALGPLAGIPVLLKDNIESTEMPTTAGSMALINNNTGRDAPIVAKLKAAGAIILGKTNLSEWANFRSESSISGWSAVGGLTRNPHILSRSACGSSSGSGAAMSLRLASLAVGTETNGSIICPASINGVVGFKPTVGLLSRTHIVPISFSQDTAGPMTSNVQDAWLMTAVMAGEDASDSATKNAGTHRPAMPLSEMLPTDLKGKRIGVVRYRQGDNPHVLAVYESALSQLKASGATLVDISDFSQPDSFWPDSYNVLLSEFHHSINEYLSGSPAEIPARNLSELIAFNNKTERELVLFNQDIFEKSLASAPIGSEQYQSALRLIQDTAGKNGIDALLAKHNVDVLVAPSNSPSFLIDGVYGDHSPAGFIGIGYLAAVAGYPHLTVPAGQVKNLPVGISFIGGKWQDENVLKIGKVFEAKHGFFIKPGLLPTRFDTPSLKGIDTGLNNDG
ncbi:amidase [Alteromonas portus]|uniref:Amidase n=1 Tax=Alteromonas portus TaxID=2565549 RepID=A0A4U0ZFM9_9ALTE|nr:amidase [Alteromonas portus]TKB02715.1 amidase [Alteromonas portus]